MTLPTLQFKIVALRDELPPSQRPPGDTPERIAQYYRQFVENAQTMIAGAENMLVVYLNVRRKITGWTQCANGTQDTQSAHGPPSQHRWMGPGARERQGSRRHRAIGSFDESVLEASLQVKKIDDLHPGTGAE